MMLKQLIALTTIALCTSAIAVSKPTPAATPNEIAADVVFIKAPEVKPLQANNPSAEIGMDVKNTGNQAHRIIAAFSPVAQQVQLHLSNKLHTQHNHLIKDIIIKPHSERLLNEQHAHIVLLGLKEKLENGHNVPIALIFDDGSWTTLFAKVSAS